MSALSSLYDFWHSYGADIQNGAVVLSAIAAFAVIRDARATAKRRGTMDLILHQESDTELIAAREQFNALKASDIKISSFGTAEKRYAPESITLRKVINLHELTAVAIQERVIDECVYRRWFNSTYIADYEATKDYIAAVRRNFQIPAAYLEYEKTALRWKQDASWYAAPGFWRRKVAALEAFIRA